jgi:DNA-binding YbaB/EbfC family protein
MFEKLGQMATLFRQLPKIKEEMEKFQQRLGQITAEGVAGGNMVTVRVNGRNEVLSCRLSDEAMQQHDRELLEELIRSAMNQALERVRQQVAEETSKMASGFGLPSGMGLSGSGPGPLDDAGG